MLNRGPRKRTTTERAATRLAIKLVGIRRIAAALGLWPSAVHHWKDKGVPAAHVIALERMTIKAGQKVARSALRPDIYPLPKRRAKDGK